MALKETHEPCRASAGRNQRVAEFPAVPVRKTTARVRNFWQQITLCGACAADRPLLGSGPLTSAKGPACACMHAYRRRTIDLLALVIVVGLAALFLIPGSTPGMDIRRYPSGLAVLERVPVNGTRQWILIRSENTTNPVVLFVHVLRLHRDWADVEDGGERTDFLQVDARTSGTSERPVVPVATTASTDDGFAVYARDLRSRAVNSGIYLPRRDSSLSSFSSDRSAPFSA